MEWKGGEEGRREKGKGEQYEREGKGKDIKRREGKESLGREGF